MNKLIQIVLSGLLLLLLSSASSAEESIIYYHNDLLGSPVAATDEQGNLLWRESYKPYGEKLLNEQTASSDKLWYTGKAHDDDIGLSYFGARYYDPVVGRFMGIDPASVLDHIESNPMMFNRYAYANNNPYKYVDPDGRIGVVFHLNNRNLTSQQALMVSGIGNTSLEVGVLGGDAILTATGIGGVVKQGVQQGIRRFAPLFFKSGDNFARGIGNLFKNGRKAKASELKNFAEQQGFKLKQSENGPLKFFDENGFNRITIKQGSSRAPGSSNPHVELRSASGQRIDPAGNPVTRKSPQNHTPIDFDL